MEELFNLADFDSYKEILSMMDDIEAIGRNKTRIYCFAKGNVIGRQVFGLELQLLRVFRAEIDELSKCAR